MKVVIEQSGYDLLNLGDLAMLQFTVDQVRNRWPEAQIGILTAKEKSLSDRFDNVQPLITAGRNALTTRDWLFGRITPKVIRLDRAMRQRFPLSAERIMLFKSRLKKMHVPELTSFRNAVASADCVIASGGGYITDSFPEMVEGVCGTLAMAQSRGIPTAMFGQGLGPLENVRLFGFAKETLPKVAALGLREPVLSPIVARDLGVPEARTTVTGDNATILAFQQKGAEIGNAIGINVRVATYSKVGDDEIEKLKSEIASLAQAIPVPLVPILISQHERDDLQSAALCPPDHERLNFEMKAPIDTIQAVSKCRIVITGSYHGAVFALAQGIPVIGLAKSEYYVAKFEGLRGLYPSAVKIVKMDEMETGALSNSARDLYESAISLRPEILTISEKIVRDSEKVCADFFDLVSARK